MIKVRVSVGTNPLIDAEVDEAVLDYDDNHKAKAAIEAWWFASQNYRGTWAVNPDRDSGRVLILL